ncbi:polyprenyl diphosphate synthase [Streptomyces erythrochromogenes]|uniref:polyprenyl diphosphate synthase n=1 Tax=Streptomyces erythrochromogenes TaxID=285574 RepID=UPI00368044D2
MPVVPTDAVAGEQVPGLGLHHLAVIADGNRRWARAQGLEVAAGYRAGAERVTDLVGWCEELGVGVVTVFLVSARNLELRPADELAPMLEAIAAVPRAVEHRHGWLVRPVGDPGGLPEPMRRRLGPFNPPADAGTCRVVNLAIGYDGRREILHAARAAAAEAAAGHPVHPDALDRHLYNNALPAPDLIVRTAGERRLSGFLLWQAVDADLHFCDTLWPDFQHADLVEAVKRHQARQRTFGR